MTFDRGAGGLGAVMAVAAVIAVLGAVPALALLAPRHSLTVRAARRTPPNASAVTPSRRSDQTR